MKPLIDILRNKKCKECDLYRGTPEICSIGQGPYPTDIVFVGEAPSNRREDLLKPFSGRAGKLVFEPILKSLDLDRMEVYITNICKCKPFSNSKPSNADIKACSHYLISELEYVKPKKIVALGISAAKGLLNKFNISLKKTRNKIFELPFSWGKAKLLITYHPANALRNPYFKYIILEDIKKFLEDRERLSTKVSRLDFPKFVKEVNNLFTLDIETNTLDPFAQDAKILSVAVSPSKGKGYYCKNRSDFNLIAPLFSFDGFIKCGHNFKFDLKFLIAHGYLDREILYHVDSYFDTLLAFNVLDENYPNKGLKELSYRFTSMFQYEMPEDFEDKERLREYNCQDCDGNKRLANYIIKKFKKDKKLLTPLKIDMRSMCALTDIELRGFKIDRKELKLLTETLEKRIAKIQKRFKDVNLNSPAQVGNFLFLENDISAIEYSPKSGNPSCKEEVLVRILKEETDVSKRKILKGLLKYRQYFKMLGFCKNIKEYMDPKGFVHPIYNIAKREDSGDSGEEEGGTKTGRLSCKNPNLQNITRKKEGLDDEINPRRVFVASAKDRLLLSVDFSQVEMIVAAIYHGEKKLIDMYLSGGDIHTEVAAEIQDIKPEEVTTDQRKAAKAINFGIIYGITHFGLAKRTKMTEEGAKRYIHRYFKRFPAIANGIQKLERQAILSGYVESYFNRRRRIIGANRQTKEGREFLRQAINAPIQSTAGDITKIVMVDIFRKLKGYNSWLIGNIHDNLLLDIDPNEKEEVIKLVKDSFAYPPFEEYGVKKFSFPLKADMKIGYNWLYLEKL